MNNLLIMHNNQAVTSSVNIAETFDKRHDHVMRDIQNLADDIPNFGEMFFKTSGVDSYGRSRWIYLMNRDGFALLAMGFTGSKALHFKVEYIYAFNEMEKALKAPKFLTEKEQLMASMKLSLNTAEEVEEVKKEVTEIRSMVEKQITLNHGEQRRLQIAIATKVYELESEKSQQPKLFKEIHREIKNRFGVSSYKDVKRQELQKAIQYVEAWLPRKVS